MPGREDDGSYHQDTQRNRSISDEDFELYGGKISSAQRGCADASSFSTTSGTVITEENDINASYGDFSSVRLEDMALTQANPSETVRAASYEFNYMPDTVYRSLSMPEKNVGVVGRLGSTQLSKPKHLGYPTEASLLNDKDIVSTQAAQNPGLHSASFKGNIVVSCLPSYYRLEPKYHRSVKAGSSLVVVDIINNVLREHKTDFEFKENKCKWKCCFANNASVVFFNIRLWKRPQCKSRESDFALEFQRRQGDAAPFIRISNEVFAAFVLAELAEEESFKLVSGRSLMPGPMSLETPRMPSDDEIAESVMPLVEMAQSGLDDAVLEGTKALAQLSSCKDHRLVLHKCGVVKALVKLLDRQDLGTGSMLTISSQMFASACLANLSEEPIVQESLYYACGLLLKKVDNGEYADRPMRREAARTLRNLAQDDQGMDALIDQIGKPSLEVWCEEIFPKLDDDCMMTDAIVVQQRLHGRLQACN